jgi:long-chain acyl-CoA synthetase
MIAMMNLDDVFRQTASHQPRQAAIIEPGKQRTLTYAELDHAIQAASDALRQAGVGPGDCVGLHCASGVSYIVFNYAIWRCGGCTVPIPVELTGDEKAEVCREIALDFLISTSGQMSFATPRGEPVRLDEKAAVVPVQSSRQHPVGFLEINSAFIRFTSGTTGASKGIVLSHESIHERIHAANEVLGIGPADRVIWMLSMSYHFTVSVVGYLTFGATIILPANHFAPAVIQATRQHEATLIYASPMHCALLADYPEAVPLPSLRLVISTTSSLDRSISEKFHQRYGRPISQALGIIEVGLPCINVDFAAERPGSVGPVLPAYRLRLEDVGFGPGLNEISFRGPGFLDAYYHPWQTRKEIMPDGWFHTRDIGELDADGCLYLRGRSKDVINVAGMKFFPQEVENVLSQHDQVAAVCVYPHRDARLGEVPYARIVAKPGTSGEILARQLRQYCQQRLASYKVPEKIEFVASLPRTASGKVLHRELS